MAKAVESDLIALAPDIEGSEVPMFDLPKLFLPGEGVDLEGVLATLLSESGSITPRTIKGEGVVNEVKLVSVLEEIIARQKPLIEARMQELDKRRAKLVDQCREAEAEKESFETAKVGGDISQAKTRSEIMEKVALSRELGKELDTIVEDFRVLLGMIQAFEASKPVLAEERKEGNIVVGAASSDKSEAVVDMASGFGYKAPIMLKTYQENAGLPGNEGNLEVLRFALVAENLRGMEGQSLISDMLHPLEVVLLSEALKQLRMLPSPTCGVVCDIFVRVVIKYRLLTMVVVEIFQKLIVLLYGKKKIRYF